MDESLVLPNFLIVGTAKAGTTSLYNYLKQHPDIYFPENKEPCFFAFADEDISYSHGNAGFVTNYSDYVSLYAKGHNHRWRGDASTPYLYFYEKTIKNIKKYVPDSDKIKIIIVLRNPVERAFSQYMMKIRDGTENLTFKDAINSENNRMKNEYHFDYFYVDRGFYYAQIKAYLDNFENVRIFLFEEFKNHIEETVRDIFDYLEVNNKIKFKHSNRYNVSGIPKIKLIHDLFIKDYALKRLLRKLMTDPIRTGLRDNLIRLDHNFNLRKISISDEDKDYLKGIYEHDIKKISVLIGRDLSYWLT